VLASSLGTSAVQPLTGITDPPSGAVFILRLTTNEMIVVLLVSMKAIIPSRSRLDVMRTAKGGSSSEAGYQALVNGWIRGSDS
jgi:hypothetical protein